MTSAMVGVESRTRRRRAGSRVLSLPLALPVALALAAALTMSACGSGSKPANPANPAPSQDTVSGTSPDTSPEATVDSTVVVATVAPRPPTTLYVPGDAPTIQRAVDLAVPGDLILIGPGTYNEAVHVRTPGITVRGVDRNAVILDGSDELENGILIAADNVAVENMTVRRYTFNGVIFTYAYEDGVDDPTQHRILQGYRASYLTVSNNQQYGVYAFFARGGRIDHVYASGHPDSGIYVGQCKPCDAVVEHVTAERNSIGYEGTNASGSLFVVNSSFVRNRIGITPNSQDMERLAPQGDIVVAGNDVSDNNAADAPATAQGAFGVGIAVAGGNRNVLVHNRVHGNRSAGIILTDMNGYQAEGNEVRDNDAAGNGVDLAYVAAAGPGPIRAGTNCFAGNTFATSNPTLIETALPCAAPVATDITTQRYSPVPAPADVDYRKVPLPPQQPTMPDARTRAATVVDAAVPVVDLTAIETPTR